MLHEPKVDRITDILIECCSLLSFPNVNSSFTKSSLIQGHPMEGDIQLTLLIISWKGLGFQLESLSADRAPEAKAAHSSGSTPVLFILGATTSVAVEHLKCI